MKPSIRSIQWVLLPAGWLVAGVALADVYTWIDAKGNTNVSNLKPPAGARIVSTTHEDPAAIARAEALQKAAQDAQLRALSDRVAELERAAEQAASAPPPPIYVPAPYAPPPAQFTVTTMPVEPAYDATPPYAMGCAWVGCGWGLYSAPLVVVSRGFGHRDFRHFKRSAGFAAPRSGGAPPRGRAPSMPTGRAR